MQVKDFLNIPFSTNTNFSVYCVNINGDNGLIACGSRVQVGRSLIRFYSHDVLKLTAKGDEIVAVIAFEEAKKPVKHGKQGYGHYTFTVMPYDYGRNAYNEGQTLRSFWDARKSAEHDFPDGDYLIRKDIHIFNETIACDEVVDSRLIYAQ